MFLLHPRIYSETLSYDQITKSNFNYSIPLGNIGYSPDNATLTLIYSENGTLLDNTDGRRVRYALFQNILTWMVVVGKNGTTITIIPAIMDSTQPPPAQQWPGPFALVGQRNLSPR